MSQKLQINLDVSPLTAYRDPRILELLRVLPSPAAPFGEAYIEVANFSPFGEDAEEFTIGPDIHVQADDQHIACEGYVNIEPPGHDVANFRLFLEKIVTASKNYRKPVPEGYIRSVNNPF